MRISDWSSDVCSSDLEFRMDENFGFEVPVSVPGVDSKILDPRQTWANGAEYDAAALKLIGLFADNFEQFAEHVDEAVRKIALRARSEEHTSELQSLMRISYAVFCLKKKTPNILQ